MNVVCSPNVLRAPKVLAVPEGLSLQAMADYLGAPEGFIVELNGEPVTDLSAIPSASDHVSILVPLGDDVFKRVLVSIAVLAASAWTAGALQAAGFSTFASSLGAAAVMTAGQHLVNSAIPIRMP